MQQPVSESDFDSGNIIRPFNLVNKRTEGIKRRQECKSLPQQTLRYPLGLFPSSQINNCFNPPLILLTIAQFVSMFVCCPLRVPRTLHQISGATLHQASPTASKGNCFLIKPPALIPMTFRRHGLAHEHTYTHIHTLRG